MAEQSDTKSTQFNYSIRVEGWLPPEWSEWFDGLTITPDSNGETLISGFVEDQSALYGLLKKIRDLGLPLISVNSIIKKYQGEKMKSNSNTVSTQEMKNRLSTFWIFIMINMAFADIIGLMVPGYMAKIVAGGPIDGIVVTSTLLLVGAFLLEIPTAMIVLSRLLKYGINRWFNIIAGVITIVYVTGMSSPTAIYWFFCSLEIIACLAIIVMSWKWQKPENEL